jgi:hypothetical protein
MGDRIAPATADRAAPKRDRLAIGTARQGGDMVAPYGNRLTPLKSQATLGGQTCNYQETEWHHTGID